MVRRIDRQRIHILIRQGGPVGAAIRAFLDASSKAVPGVHDLTICRINSECVDEVALTIEHLRPMNATIGALVAAPAVGSKDVESVRRIEDDRDRGAAKESAIRYGPGGAAIGRSHWTAAARR